MSISGVGLRGIWGQEPERVVGVELEDVAHALPLSKSKCKGCADGTRLKSGGYPRGGGSGSWKLLPRRLSKIGLFTNSGSWGDISLIMRRQTGTGERENGQIVRCSVAWGG